MASAYLQTFLDNVDHLPTEMKRNMTLLRDLDFQSHRLLQMDGGVDAYVFEPNPLMYPIGY